MEKVGELGVAGDDGGEPPTGYVDMARSRSLLIVRLSELSLFLRSSTSCGRSNGFNILDMIDVAKAKHVA